MRKIRIGITGIMLIIGAVIFVVYLYFVNFGNVVSVILTINLQLALISVAIALCVIGLYTLSWKILLKKPGLKFAQSYEIILVSIFGDLMIPTGSISGEILRISLTNKKSKLSIGEITASVLLHRILLGTSFGITLGISIIWVILSGSVIISLFYFFLVLAAVFIVLGIVGIYFAFKSRRFGKLVERWVPRAFRVVKFFRPKYEIDEFRSEVLEGYVMFSDAMECVKKTTVLASMAILVLYWFVGAFIPYLIFYSLGYPALYQQVLVVYIFICMVQIIPIGIPGLVGIVEVSMTAFFIGFGIPSTIAASATILTRLIIFWFELALGAVAASLQGVRNIAMSNQEENILKNEFTTAS